ncbi:MAG: filamentous hemagglutinin [Parvibaculaceae bacterium]|nr:filamentous hemagglutinin [Parvibaculaceae bacterium]
MRQTDARPAGVTDSYKLTQDTAPRAGTLALGQYTALGRTDLYDTDILIGDVANSTGGLAAGDALPASRANTAWFDAARLNADGLGGLDLGTRGAITVDRDLTLANGGSIELTAPVIDINANITAHSGSITATNIMTSPSLGAGSLTLLLDGISAFTLHQGTVLDLRGLWTNALTDPDDLSGLAWLDGGRVSLQSTGDVTLEQGSLIDVSSGAAILATGKTQGGKGGDVSLASNFNVTDATGELVLDGDIRGYGVNGGGTLAVQAGRVVIGKTDDDETSGTPQSGTLVLDEGFFNKGFSAYNIAGNRGLTVAEGAQVDVTAPVFRVTAAGMLLATGADPAAGLELWTPPLYQEDPVKGVLTQRQGASLSLQAGTNQALASDVPSISLTIGKDAVINVDPGQSIAAASIGQLTVDGTLRAPGGNISLKTLDILFDQEQQLVLGAVSGRSIWIGENARLDVAAVSATAQDLLGRRYGLVSGGGGIVIGGEVNDDLGQSTASNSFIVVRPGAVLDASGTEATLDIAGLGAVDVASNGGSISLASYNGLYLDGTMLARAGGAGAAGGTLNVALPTAEVRTSTNDPVHLPIADPRVRAPRALVLGEAQGDSVLPTDLEAGASDASLVYGHARLGIDTMANGGFDNLSIMSDLVQFDGNLNLHVGQNLNIYGQTGLAAGAPQDARVVLDAAYARLAGFNYGSTSPSPTITRTPVGSAVQPISFDSYLGVTADLIDIRDGTTVNFGLAKLQSNGDLRFLQGVNPVSPGVYSTGLSSNGSITLRAAQIYPATGVKAQVGAALVLRIEAGTADTPAVPYSAFGDLMLTAPTVEQGGVVRAPLGHVQIGSGDSKVTLLPGSVTSVSGDGLQMPYGGTVDGLSYLYDGKAVKLIGVGGSDGNNLLLGVTLSGTSVDVQHDAVLDLSGGGELLGAGFISGRGGSTDARYTPLMQIGSDGKMKLPGSATNPVYAIVPGVQKGYAPPAGASGAVDPVIGQQITLRQGIPGLPAGTYTLMPASYALLPGAFRVELNGLVKPGMPIASSAMGNGSWATAAQLGIVNTGIADSLFRQVIVTPGAVLRTYSQYDETSYDSFALADAARIGVPRAMLEADAKSLFLDLNPGAGADAFRFNGTALFGAAEGGYGGSVEIAKTAGYTTADFEIVAAGSQATAGFNGVTLDAGVLNAMGASRLVIGGLQYASYGQNGTTINTSLGAHNVVLRSGATLAAPEVFLSAVGDLTIEQGASINTLGRGKAAYDATDGFNYANGTGFVSVSTVAVSNGVLSILPATFSGASGNLQIGACLSGVCTGDTELYSEGTIVLGTSGRFALDDAVRYGTRNLTLSVQAINVGDSAALADAEARNVLPAGLLLNQSVLDRLLRGDTRYGAPALETLVLNASTSVNFYGSVTLDTIDPVTGKSTLDTLVLGTPAIYGSGGAGDVATIRTGNLIWKGSTAAPGTVVADGAGNGIGTLNIEAARIEFGYGPGSQPTGEDNDARLALGFANVNLRASDRVTANEKGSLSVYQSQGAYQPETGYQYSGGNLNIETPLITGEAGSVNSITAGGSVRLTAPAGAAANSADAALGGELNISGHDVFVDTVVALPSGKLTLSAEHDLTLTDRAVIDMAGRTIAFNDVSKYSWGGDVVLESRSGDIHQAAGSVIDLSAQYNRAGTLKALALDDAAGVVDLQGKILGSSSGMYDAGGTLVPYEAAEVEIRAQHLGDSGTLDTQFTALNQRLNDGGVFGARSFQLKQGDLTIGDGLKAGEINVSVDNGSLTVLGTIDASGASVGSIYLAASNNLTIAGSALLDAHGTTLRVDSYGKIIDSPNRAIVNLTSGDGQLTLASGARIDLRHGTDAPVGSTAYDNDGLPRGTLELNARRTGETSGDIRIDASGTLDIRGARSIAVNGTWQYDDAAYGTDPAASGRPYQVIDQAYLDAKNLQSIAFMDAALANRDLMDSKLAGLRAYTDAFHLRPGVEIVSATPDGDLVVQGDLDLSGYRYASVNPHTQQTGVYGSGEPGALVIRAGGNLEIYGSINDGFAPPPVTQDDNGWLLLPGVNFNGSDTVVPHGGVVIADGTTYEGGTTLNYDLPIKAMTFDGGLVIPAPSALTAPLAVPAGTVFSAAVRDASGTIIHAAGSILGVAETLPTGTRFDAGMRLPGTAQLAALVWPKGVPLPLQIGIPNGSTSAPRPYVLDGDLTLPLGAFLPAAANIKLPAGVDSVDLRPSANSRQGALWALAPMLPEGSQSWSLRLVAGADTTAADSRIVQAHPKQGDLRLADAHYGMFGFATGGYGWSQEAIDLIGDPNLHAGDPIDPSLAGYDSAAQLCSDIPEFCVVGNITYQPVAGSSRFSVVRTGAADLELLAGLNLRMDTLYGVYTAGTSSQGTGANDPYNLPRAIGPNGTVLNDSDGANEKFVDGGPDSLARAWYPTGGGNLTVKAGGDLTGDLMQQLSGGGFGRPNPEDTGYASAAIGTWLWRQGSGATLGQGNDQPTAWWINFGSYVPSFGSGTADRMVGFTGFGTLGGGNLRMDVGGDAGILSQRGELQGGAAHNMHSQGLVLAVGSTGRVLADGSLSLTGGGDIDLRIGGTLNPFTQDAVYNQDNADKNAALTGTIVNLRGDMQLQAGSIGNLPLQYGAFVSSVRDTRATDPFAATGTRAQLGLVLAPGDSNYSISTRGDLVIKGVDDPGRVTLANKTPFSVNGDKGSGESWFSLWTAHTAINLFSAGGDLTPITPNGDNPIAGDIASTDSAFVYPSILSAVAASGSLYYGNAAKLNRNGIDTGDLLLAPSANGRLEFLAAGSIYAEGYDVSQSGASSGAMATPFHPAFSGTTNGGVTKSNLAASGNRATPGSSGMYPLFAFGPDTVSGEWDFEDPARFYAVNGDLVGVSSGRVITYAAADTLRAGQKWYQGGPVWMMAGRDIVGSGTAIGKDEVWSNSDVGDYSSADNLFVNGDATDVSQVSAGRDILYSSFNVAGPGTLDISAGRNILMADKARVTSLGPVVPGDNRPGASIAMQAGVGASGPDYAALLPYLDPANLVPAGTPLEGSGKVAKTYEKELAAWLKQRYGFDGSTEQARSYFGKLAPEQQHIFLRQVYYAELTAGGREYNDPASTRFGSYLRGRDAIVALFPDKDAQGNPITYTGNITMFGGSGVRDPVRRCDQ